MTNTNSIIYAGTARAMVPLANIAAGASQSADTHNAQDVLTFMVMYDGATPPAGPVTFSFEHAPGTAADPCVADTFVPLMKWDPCAEPPVQGQLQFVLDPTDADFAAGFAICKMPIRDAERHIRVVTDLDFTGYYILLANIEDIRTPAALGPDPTPSSTDRTVI